MAVTRGNGGKRPGSGGGRSRPDFTPSKNKKLVLKLDCMAGRGKSVGPKWGFELPVAMPYSTRFDDIDIKKVDPGLIKSTTGLLLEAVGTLWDAYDEAQHKNGDVAVVEVAGWEPVTTSGGKKYFKP